MSAPGAFDELTGTRKFDRQRSLPLYHVTMFSRKLQRTAWIALALLIVLQCKEEPKLKARINRTKGSVEIVSGTAKKAAAVGDLLLPGDRLVTGSDSSVDLLFPGGSVLRLQQSSDLTLEELGAKSQMKLDKGDLLLGVSKLKASESMQITTPTVVAAVRGTSFSISTIKNAIAVLTGKVQVEKDGQSVVAESMKEVRTDEDKLQSAKLSKENADQLREILEIEGVQNLDDFEEMQKNWAGFALENNLDYLPAAKQELPSREVREK